MIKKITLILLLLVAIWGCSSSFDTADMGPEERLQYAIGLYTEEDYLEAEKELEAVLLQYPGSIYADDAQYYLAMTKFKKEEYILAAYEFSKLIKNMPASEFVADAQFYLAESYYQLSPNFNLDQKYTTKAIDEFQAFIDFFPLNEKVAEAERKINELNTKLAHKHYSIAVIYEKMEYYSAALKYYEDVFETYHDTEYGPQALYSKILLLIDRERNTEAVADMKKFLDKYPEDKNSEEIKNLLESYEKVPGSEVTTN
jgi:outer membrane protein assembly factor BamD